MFHQYNTFQYNTKQYNADAFYLLLSCLESITEADTKTESVDKSAIESISSTSTITNSFSRVTSDSLVTIDVVTKQVTGKVLRNRVRSNDWLGIKQNPQSDTWG